MCISFIWLLQNEIQPSRIWCSPTYTDESHSKWMWYSTLYISFSCDIKMYVKAQKHFFVNICKNISKTYINVQKESTNVDKRCTFSILVSSYDHLYAMNDKIKPPLMCESANCIQSSCLWGHLSHSRNTSPHKHTQCEIISCSHTHAVFLLQCNLSWQAAPFV